MKNAEYQGNLSCPQRDSAEHEGYAGAQSVGSQEGKEQDGACISGTIGWIGLAIPNLMRLLVQNDGRKLMPLSIVYGILFTVICDLLARTITNTEIPVGIISGFLGAIMFIIVLFVQAKRSKQ